jgi:hypothetical protein
MSVGLSENDELSRVVLLGATRRRAAIPCGVYCPGGGVWFAIFVKSVGVWVFVKEVELTRSVDS